MRSWVYLIQSIALWMGCLLLAHAQTPDTATQELLRQRERERVLREQLEVTPQARLPSAIQTLPERLPQNETPCFPIARIQLTGDDAAHFLWALKAADLADDPASGRCLGLAGINTVIKNIQNAIVARGFVTTHVLAAPQDLTTGNLDLTVMAGRIHGIRFADGTDARARVWNAVPFSRGDILNLHDIEQALENFKRVPTVEADIQIATAQGEDAEPGSSDVVITWQQRVPPLRFQFTLDDSGSKATGKLQGSATLSFDHMLTWNDLFYVNVNWDMFNGNTKGTRGYTVHYSLPYGYWTLGATTSDYRYHQTVAGFSQNYVYSGTSKNAELRLSRLMYRGTTSKLALYVRGWVRRSNNFIDDTEIEVQRRRTGGWEVGTTHREYLGASTFDASVAYRRGTGAFQSIPAPEETFGEGTSRMRVVTANAQWVTPFRIGEKSLRYIGSWRAQWDRTPLVPQDHFSIGGRYTVRGFDGELTLLGERGWVVRNDIGIALGADQELYLGADYGHVGGASVRWLLGNHLAGAVLGLRGGLYGFDWDVFVGKPITKPEGFKTNPLTAGFQLSWAY